MAGVKAISHRQLYTRYIYIYMSHGQNQLFMLRMLSIVIVFGGDLIGFQLFVQPDAFGIRIYIVDA